MDLSQTDHPWCNGIAYSSQKRWHRLAAELPGRFLYHGTMLTTSPPNAEYEAYFEQIDGATAAQILPEVQGENTNMDAVRPRKAPKIAVYTPRLRPGTTLSPRP